MYSSHDNRGLRGITSRGSSKGRPYSHCGRDFRPETSKVKTIFTALVIIGLLALSCAAFALGKHVWGIILIVLAMVVLVLALDDGENSGVEPWE